MKIWIRRHDTDLYMKASTIVPDITDVRFSVVPGVDLGFVNQWPTHWVALVQERATKSERVVKQFMHVEKG
jgi:hypothetical protein